MKFLANLLGLFLCLDLLCAPMPPSRVGERLLKEKVAEVFPNASRIEVINFSVRGKIPESARLLGLHPELPLGQVQAEYVWESSGRTQQALATAVVRVYSKVIVAHSDIAANEPFTNSNCRTEEREISTLRVSGFFDNWKDLEDYRARGFVSHGTVIGQLQIAKPILVNAGQVVDLVYSRSKVTISARVKALERGVLNQWIRVENPTTKRVIQGRVADYGKVSVK